MFVFTIVTYVITQLFLRVNTYLCLIFMKIYYKIYTTPLLLKGMERDATIKNQSGGV